MGDDVADTDGLAPARFRIGIDIGGTFTDFTAVDDVTGKITVTKHLTTPDQPEKAVLAGLEGLTERLPDLLPQSEAVVHATTLATNVVIERKGAPTALLTTEGFRDILEIGRESRYHLYDPFIRFPVPLIPRPLRVGVSERVYADGTVIKPLDEDDVLGAVELLRSAGVRSVAVCYLHAYREPEHERRTRDLLLDALPGVSVSLSHEVHPEPKEYERTSTTVVDAYVKPVIDGYLERLEARLDRLGYSQRLLMMQSNGGVISAETARRHPIQIIESGPAAGVEAAAYYGRLLGEHDVVSFDMGGTTAKLCLLQGGDAARTRSFEVDRVSRFRQGSGIPVAIPVYDLLEIGAGGGSIARLNDLGLLQVGPDSAGSDPGPACYRSGGTAPTVTDANVVLGHLDPDHFLGGEMPLDAAAARTAVNEDIAKPSELPVRQAACSIVDLVNETMAAAARIHIADKGKDAKGLTIVAFGGAGPLHACALARKLGCRRVIIPPLPGVMSSFGLLATSLAFEQAAAIRQLLDELDGSEIEKQRRDLEIAAAAALPDNAAERFRCIAEICHLSQDYPLEVEISGDLGKPLTLEKAKADFRRQYEDTYGRTDDDNPLELVALRVQALSPPRPIEMPALERSDTRGTPASAEENRTRQIYQRSRDEMVEAPVFVRESLKPGTEVAGPAVIEERESTTVLGVGDLAIVDDIGCLVIQIAPTGAEAVQRHPEFASS